MLAKIYLRRKLIHHLNFSYAYNKKLAIKLITNILIQRVTTYLQLNCFRVMKKV